MLGRPGAFKVAERFDSATLPTSAGMPLREVSMLRRLGLTDAEIEDYLADVEHVSRST